MMLLGLTGISSVVMAQHKKPEVKIEKLVIEYKGKKVKARQLTVHSVLPMDMERAWNNVKTPAVLQYVAKGMISFKPSEGPLPAQWEAGKIYGVKMRLFGFIPFGGTHYLYVDKIDDPQFYIATKEWDKTAKVWNHEIILKSRMDGNINYEDRITIYGGFLTGLVTQFAKRFYIHRQKRWQMVASQNLDFTQAGK